MRLEGRRLAVVALVVGLAAAAVYATRLGYARIYLTHDAVNFSLQSLSIAETVPYGDVYARFYSQVFRPGSVPETPTVTDGATFDVRGAHPRSWLIAAADERWLSSLPASEWERIAIIKEPSGEASFAVDRRRAP